MQKIVIHSVPRSGSTWLGQIINSHPDVIYKYQPLFSYAFKDYLTPNSRTEEIDLFFEKIEQSKDVFINQKEGIEKGIIPKFPKSTMPTHICYKEVRYHHILDNLLSQCKDIKVVLLVRNPLAVLYSWKNAPKEFKKELGWNFEKEWLNAPSKNLDKLEEYNGYSKWREASTLFLNLKEKYPENVMLVKYIDLLKNTNKKVEEIFLFSNLKESSQTKNFLNNSKCINQNDAYSVYKVKNKDTNWTNLPNHIIDFIKEDLKNTELNSFLDG